MADTAPAPAAAAAPADVAPPKTSFIGIAINIAIMYMLWSNFHGSATKAMEKGAEASDVPATSTADALTPTPTPAAAAAVDPTSPWAFLEVLKESSSGKRKVMPELQAYEDDRRRRLDATREAAAAPGGRGGLHNIWPQGTPFDIFVYLSERADPIDVFSMDVTAPSGWADTAAAAGREGAGAGDEGGEALVARPAPASPGGKSGGGFLSGHVEGGLAALLTTTPPIRLPNTSFTALVDNAGNPSSSSSSHAPPLLWKQGGLTYDFAEGTSREQVIAVSLPPAVREKNGTLFAHLYVCALGTSPDPSSPRFRQERVISSVIPVLKWLKKRPTKRVVNLLTGDGGDNAAAAAAAQKQPVWGIGLEPEAKGGAGSGAADGAALTEAQQEEEEERRRRADPVAAAAADAALPFLPYFKPTLHLQLIVDSTKYAPKSLPPHMLASIETEPALGGYKPPLYVNDFWMLNHHLVGPLNGSVASVPLTVSYSPQEMWKWALEAQMQVSWETQAAMGTSSDSDTDMLKSIMTDTNPILLAVTALVSILHMVFEFLAFRNDVSFWRSAKTLEGLSVRALTMNFVQMVRV
jgi:hypothetical protein